MIQYVTAVNGKGQQIKMGVGSEGYPGVTLQSIDGLGPAKATISTTEIATYQGSFFNGSRVGERNVLLTLALNDYPSIEEVRHKMYQIFQVGDLVDLYVKTDRRFVRFAGYVEANEPDIFSQNETIVISLLCPDPNMYDASENYDKTTQFRGLVGGFQFPFANNSLEDPLLSFANMEQRNPQNVYYTGDTEIGIEFEVEYVSGVATNVRLENLKTGKYMTLLNWRASPIISGGIQMGDIIQVNTRKNEKSVTHIRAGVKTNALELLDAGSSWLTVTPGDNLFEYTAFSGVEHVWFTVYHRNVYRGV